jgi:hypothetical protein
VKIWVAAIAMLGGILFPTVAHATRYQCPTELEPLVVQMLKDLPSYANRAIVRSRRTRSVSQLGSVLTAGRPEFEPLPINSSSQPDPTLQQVFITTLEREVVSGKRINLQQFHWLFLTRTDAGWQLALMFTRTGGYPTTVQPTTPPRESSQGIVGQAVRTWLRDCNSGFVRP